MPPKKEESDSKACALRPLASEWLEMERNRSKLLNFLDRPFVVTFIGGVIIAALTFLWQDFQRRQATSAAYETALATQQIDLLKQLSPAFEGSGGALNGWFTRLIWIAEETNNVLREPNETTKQMRNDSIDGWKKEILSQEERFNASGTLDGVLNLTSSLYRCKSVSKPARDLSTVWQGFQGYFQTFNREWNDKQLLDKEKIDKASAFRKATVDRMNKLKAELLREMALELVGFRDGTRRCASP